MSKFIAGKGGLILLVVLGSCLGLSVLATQVNTWVNGYSHCESNKGWETLNPACAVEDAKEVLGSFGDWINDPF